MRKITLTAAVLALAIGPPLRVMGTQEQDAKDKPKPEVGVEVKVEREGGRDNDDKNPQRRVEVRVLRHPDGEGRGQAGPAKKETYIGVAIAPVPPALAAQFPDIFSKEQGLLVAQVSDESPAAKAELQHHDVLLTYDDQKLFSAEQFAKLVRSDKPGRAVAIGLLRAGKEQKVEVTLAERETRSEFQFFPGGHEAFNNFKLFMNEPDGHPQKMPRQFWLRKDGSFGGGAGGGKGGVGQGSGQTKTKSKSVSITMKTVDGDRLKADVQYQDAEGETKEWSFEGTRDEMRKALESNKELPQDIRQQMLHNLETPAKNGARFRLTLPGSSDAFAEVDTDFDLTLPALESVDKVFQQLDSHVNPLIREQLKGAFRSLEERDKTPALRDRSF